MKQTWYTFHKYLVFCRFYVERMIYICIRKEISSNLLVCYQEIQIEMEEREGKDLNFNVCRKRF